MGRPRGSKNRTTGRRFKKFEGRFGDDKHIRLTKDMMTDERFLSLSSGAVRLYLYFKLWACGRDEVEFSISLAQKFMSKPTFIKARDELVKAGFIDFVNKYAARDKREIAHYEFSDRWQWENRLLLPSKIKNHVKEIDKACQSS